MHTDLLEQVSALLSAAPDYEETLRQVARLVVPSLGDWCILDIVGEDGGVRRLEVAHADPARQELARELRRFPAGPANNSESPASEALRSGRSLLYADTVDEVLVRATTAPEHLALLRALGPKSAMVVPLVARGRTLGVLSVFAAESGRRYSQADLQVLEELARRCALSLDNARMLDAERRERASSQSLQAITAALSKALTAQDVANAVIQEGLPGIGADAGAVSLLNSSGDVLELVGAVGYPHHMVAGFTHQPLSASTPMSQAARTRLAVWRDGQVDSSATFPDYARLNRAFGAGAALPLIAGERLLGAVALSFGEARPFSERDRTFATALATQCALALERARLYEGEMQARAVAEAAQQRLAYLAEATSLLSSSLEYELTLTRVAQLAVPRLADACIVDILNLDGSVRRLPPVFADGAPLDVREGIEQLGAPQLDGPGAAASVLRTGEAFILDDVNDAALSASARGADHLRILRDARITSAMILPLEARGSVLGAMTLVMTAHSGRRYTEVERRLAVELTARAAFAMDNARLYASERRARATAEQAVDRAARLERVMSALAHALTADDVASILLREACAVLGTERGLVAVRDETQSDEITLVHARGYREEVIERYRRMPLEAALPIPDAMRSGHILFATSRADRLDRYPALIDDSAALFDSTMVVVPLLEGTVAIGALMLTFDSARPVDPSDQDFLILLGRHAAEALARARLFDATRAAERAAQDAIRARDEFLSIASHELRTPVAAIKGMAQMLDRAQRRGQLDAERLNRWLEQLARSSDRLAGLTGDLLDVSLLQTGRLVLHQEVFDFGALVAEVLETSQVQVDATHRLELHGEATCDVRVDRLRIEQVLVNLIENAVKYSPAGGVVLVQLSAADAGIEVCVHDDGIGLPPDQLERIFQPFGRASNASGRHIQGMGLGLYVCRRIVEQHGGRIWADSAGEDRGTTLRIWLPCVTSGG